MKAAHLFAATSLVLATACSVQTNDPGPGRTVIVEPNEPLSTLTVRWTLAGSLDPAACTQSFADVIDISIIAPESGAELQAFQQTCETFATSITLAPGVYSGRARLVDSAGVARTTDVTIPSFTLRGNDELVQDVEFPADSFR